MKTKKTRQQIRLRKKLAIIYHQIESLREEDQNFYDQMPDDVHEDMYGMLLYEAIYHLEEAIKHFNEVNKNMESYFEIYGIDQKS